MHLVNSTNNSILKSSDFSALDASNNICIKEVIDKSQLKDFINLPLRLYKGNKFYVPQLSSEVTDTFNKKCNPAYEFCDAKCWLAYKNGKVVGRIAGIINHAYIKKWKNKYVRFGWIDFEEDENITKALLKVVEDWAKEKEMTAVHGPLGFTNFDHAGLLTEGYNYLGTFATIYNYPYYPFYIEKSGYLKDVEALEYKIKVPETLPCQLNKIAAIVEKRYKLTIINTLSKKDILKYAKDIFCLLNSTYTDLYGMVELNEKQIQFNVKKFLSFIRPDFASLVFDNKTELIAFGITTPSLSVAMQKAKGKIFPFGWIYLKRALKKCKIADLCLVAIRKDYQGKGVNAILMRQIIQCFIKNGIIYAESNPEMETNTKVQSLWNYFNAVQHKRRICYIKFI